MSGPPGSDIKASLAVLQMTQEQKASEWIARLDDKRPIFIADSPEARRTFIQMTKGPSPCCANT